VYADDVAENGDAVFIQQIASINAWPVYRYRGGTLTPLTSTTTNAKYMNARTDGVNVIFQRYYIGYNGGLDLYTSAGMVSLVPENTPCASLGLILTYAVDNGWTAYSSPDSSCQTQQIWVRAPDDTRTQVSVWSTSSTVDAINDAGQVMMLNTSSLGANRYLASAGVFPETISSTLGHAIWLDGQWYVVMGRTLFSIGPVPPPSDAGTGAMDASAAPPPTDASAPVEPSDMSAPASGAAKAQARGCTVAPGAPANGGSGMALTFLLLAAVRWRRARATGSASSGN
jgi:hypothetical protein